MALDTILNGYLELYWVSAASTHSNFMSLHQLNAVVLNAASVRFRY